MVKSSNPNFKEGDVVLGAVGIEKYTVVSEAAAKASGFRKIDNPHNLPLSNFTSALGMPGLTA